MIHAFYASMQAIADVPNSSHETDPAEGMPSRERAPATHVDRRLYGMSLLREDSKSKVHPHTRASQCGERYKQESKVDSRPS